MSYQAVSSSPRGRARIEVVMIAGADVIWVESGWATSVPNPTPAIQRQRSTRSMTHSNAERVPVDVMQCDTATDVTLFLVLELVFVNLSDCGPVHASNKQKTGEEVFRY